MANKDVVVFELEVTRSQIQWQIKKFFSRPPESRYSYSKYFSFLNNNSSCIYVYHNLKNKKDELAFNFIRQDPVTQNRFCIKIWVKTADGSMSKPISKVLEFKRGVSTLSIGAIDRAELLNSKDRCLPNGDLSVVCSLSLSDSTLSQNLEHLFLSEHESDVIIKVKGKQFKSHRSILVARSTVFATMFAQDMTENLSGTVDIKDCDPDSFRVFLLYLYTEKTDHVTSDNAPILYYIADKYAVEELKVECIDFMSRNMSVNSICDVLVVASTHSEPNLLQSATEFFLKNMKEILMTKKWDDFQSQHFSLSKDLLLKAADLIKM